MKTLVLAAVLISFSALVFSQSNNYFWGYKGPYDVLLNRTFAIKSSTILQVKTMDLIYPLKVGSPNMHLSILINSKWTHSVALQGQQGRNISAINITDQYINGKGGYASLLAGGIGYNNVTIHLKSQRGNGFNFIVEIYGR